MCIIISEGCGVSTFSMCVTYLSLKKKPSVNQPRHKDVSTFSVQVIYLSLKKSNPPVPHHRHKDIITISMHVCHSKRVTHMSLNIDTKMFEPSRCMFVTNKGQLTRLSTYTQSSCNNQHACYMFVTQKGQPTCPSTRSQRYFNHQHVCYMFVTQKGLPFCLSN